MNDLPKPSKTSSFQKHIQNPFKRLGWRFLGKFPIKALSYLFKFFKWVLNERLYLREEY